MCACLSSVCLGYKVTGATRSGDSVTVSLEKKDGSSKEEVTVDAVLVSVGRRPYTNDLGLESVGIVKDDKGRVPVNGAFQTIVPRYVVAFIAVSIRRKILR